MVHQHLNAFFHINRNSLIKSYLCGNCNAIMQNFKYTIMISTEKPLLTDCIFVLLLLSQLKVFKILQHEKLKYYDV